MPVVATFSILGDMTQHIGGERIALTTLVGPDGDAHVYEPGPSDAKAVSAARVLVVNGLGFEGWMDRLKQASGFAGRRGGGQRGDRAADPGRSGTEATTTIMAASIRMPGRTWPMPRSMSATSRRPWSGPIPQGAAFYRANAAAYLAELQALDAAIAADLWRQFPRRSGCW